jgi:hypothetical protein
MLFAATVCTWGGVLCVAVCLATAAGPRDPLSPSAVFPLTTPLATGFVNTLTIRVFDLVLQKEHVKMLKTGGGGGGIVWWRVLPFLPRDEGHIVFYFQINKTCRSGVVV